jgi:anti-sigma-K factor RskA
MSDGNLSDFTGIGVTVEPYGGSDQPTGPRIFKVDFLH